MSLAIVTLTPDGIVLSAESRQTYTNQLKSFRIGTENAKKLFQISKRVGVVIAGRAFALDEKTQLKSIGWFIEQFKKDVLKEQELGAREIVEKLIEYLTQKKIDGLSMIVAGYELDGMGKAYLVNVPGTIEEAISRDTSFGGFLRIGQQEVVTRIMNGWGTDIFGLDFVKKAQQEGVDVAQELNKANYIVNWSTITMQDAVDFCVLMIRITESVQRFSDGTLLNPGDIPGVGGAINIATITPEEGFLWLQRKELKAND